MRSAITTVLKSHTKSLSNSRQEMDGANILQNNDSRTEQPEYFNVLESSTNSEYPGKDVNEKNAEVEAEDDIDDSTKPAPSTARDSKPASLISSKAEDAPKKVSSGNLYITINSKGKLGNQMFQYATLYCLTKTNRAWTPYLKGKKSYKSLLKTFGSRLTVGHLSFTPSNVHTINVMANAKVHSLQKTLGRLPTDRNVTIKGYFQSYRFFDRCKHDIRKQFDFSDAWKQATERYLLKRTPDRLRTLNYIRVGIHVRRTSMIIDEKLAMGYLSPPLSYYQHAMEYFSSLYKRVLFVVTSDDIGWCEANFRAEYIVFIVGSVASDMLTLSLCDHLITSVGTYSWWAGWLNSGTTVYYGVLPKADTYAGQLYANNSYIPPDDQFNKWIAVV